MDNIKTELCIWLLRNEDFETNETKVSSNKLLTFITSKLTDKYTEDISLAILPTETELESFLENYDEDYFVSERSDFADFVNDDKSSPKVSTPFTACVLTNDLSDTDNIFKIVHQLLTRGAKGVLFTGPPGTSKTWYALKIALKIIDGDDSKLERVQFHPSFTYEDFIEGLVSTCSISGEEPLFKPKDKVFLKICDEARDDIDNLYILIIDEFSRGDPSKIFGELLTYIEPDYREIEFRLPYSEKKVSIPQNVIIFATMNPYDKSVVDLDSAMERRFDVVELLPNVNILRTLLLDSDVDGKLLGKIVTFFNTANRLSPHGFGHTYFKGITNEIDLILLWNHKLKFIFGKMFRFQEDAYSEIKQAFINIVGNVYQDEIS